ncbi:MAG: signal recognition particle receptor subunit alpha, partial [Rhizobium sp.]|nr:signal recognition particle receptor subunit alpha [Rhizobium sp.]
MALGFIKKVFTFGKDKPAADKPSETEDFASLVDAAEEVDAGETIEALPEATDPIAAEVIDTAGGPAADEAEPEVTPPGLPAAPPTGGGTDARNATDSSAKHPIPNEMPPHAAGSSSIAAEEHAAATTAVPPPVGGMPGRAGGESNASADRPTLEEPAGEPISARADQPPLDTPNPPADIALPKGFATTTSLPEPAPDVPAVKLSWFQRLRQGLARTSSQLTGQIAALFTKRKLDEDTLEELEDLLIQADLGVETAMRVTGALSSERYGKDVSGEDVSRIMAAEITKVLKPVAKPLALDLSHKPHVILVVGVNGTGKTTTIGKLAAKLSGSGLKVMLAAGDTFRAAAIEQLKIWADRTGSTFIGTKLGADAASLAYEAFEKARAEKSDVLIIDTAGRLQNKTELMAELEKIVRVLGTLDPDAPHTVLQTL